MKALSRLLSAGLCTCLAASALGCSGEVPRATPAGTESPKAEKRVVAVEVVDRAGYDEVIARHRGEVVLVDIWATWCGPCREVFPHTVELSHQYGKKGLAVVSLSIDEFDGEADEAATKQNVLKFLESQGATFDNLLARGTPEKSVSESFEVADAIPQFKLYDRQGKLHKNFHFDAETGTSYTPQEIEATIQKLLKQR
jgi:thiol-disulfide isomerase/thioredoxin